MKNLSLILLALFFITACNSVNEEQKISGKIANAEGIDVSLIGFTSNGQPDTIATAVLPESGEFEMPIQTGNLAFYILSVGDKDNIVLALDSTNSPVVTADYITIQEIYEVKNSKDSENIRDTYVDTYRYMSKLDSLMNAMRESAQRKDDDARVEQANMYNATRKEFKEYLLGKIDADSTDIGNFSILQQLDPEEDLSYFQRVRNGLQPRMSGNIFFDQLANNIAQMERNIGPGTVAPDIVLPTPEGEEVALSSLRGNYVLIDFWAAWCKPCRVENPNVVRLYDKYRDDNFEIYGVSLDQHHDRWVEAIAHDKLTWTQVSDLKYWQSAAAQLYNVTAIPYTVLLDPDGKVIATKLRGKNLENKLASIFGH